MSIANLLQKIFHKPLIKEATFTAGWKKERGCEGVWGGVRLILLLFNQFIQSIRAHSTHTDPWSLCVTTGMVDTDRISQETPKLAASSLPLLFACTEQGHPTKMARQAKQAMNEQWRWSPSSHTPHTPHTHTHHHPCGCVLHLSEAEQAGGCHPEWVINGWGKEKKGFLLAGVIFIHLRKNDNLEMKTASHIFESYPPRFIDIDRISPRAMQCITGSGCYLWSPQART